jgi:hypothetical protein
MNLNEALDQLDPEIDEHWTANGQPRIDFLKALMGAEGANLTRGEVTEAEPDLTREFLADALASENEDLDDNDDDVLADLDVDAQIDEATDDPLSSSGGDAAAVVPVEDMNREQKLDHYLADHGLTLAQIYDNPELALGLPMPLVSSALELAELASKGLSIRHLDLLKKKKAIEDRIEQNARKSNIVDRIVQRIKAESPQRKGQEIRDYLQSQNAARLKRAENARAFIRSGTSAQAVADQLAVISKLDRVMSSGKGGHGSRRPAPRPLL